MGFLTTEKCFGCLSLRLGGLILGWIPLLLCIREIILAIKFNHLQIAGACAVLVVLLVFWIQGIVHEKPAWMFPMVIFWNVALWAEIICYAIGFYYRNIASTKNPHFHFTREEMLFMPLATVIIWHFAAVSYSLYEKIDEENSRPTILPQTTARTPASAAAATQPQPQTMPPAPPTPPPSYDRIYKV